MRKEIKAASASKKAICSQLFVINYSVKFFGAFRCVWAFFTNPFSI
jgi:hypothetical protein